MGLSPEFAMQNEGLKSESLRRILRAGLLGLGAGAGSMGLMHLLKKLTKPKGPSYQVPVDVDMPVPAMKTSTINPLNTVGRQLRLIAGTGAFKGIDDADSGLVEGALKGVAREIPHVPLSIGGALAGAHGMSRIPIKNQALSSLLTAIGEVGGGIGGYVASHQAGKALTKKSDWASSLVHNVLPTPAGESPPSVFTPRWLRGDTQTSRTGIPWYTPALFGAGAAGLGGGSALVNWLAKKHRKKVLKGDLSKAEKEYEDAMLGQYEKKSSAEKTYTLDDVVDLMEKQGISLNDILGKGLGAYMTGAGALGVGAGYGAYKWLKGRSQDQLLEKALKQRALMRALSHPPDIYVHPVHPGSRKRKAEQET